MEIAGEYTYQIYLQGDINRVISSVVHADGELGFHVSLRVRDTPKIYVIHHRQQVYYVGYAGQPITARLRYGLNPKSARGYAGYKWKNEAEVSITVFAFSADPGLDYPAKRHWAEAIEAEVVFGLRERTGLWPLYQQEIHFNNDHPAEVRACAGKILDKILMIS